ALHRPATRRAARARGARDARTVRGLRERRRRGPHAAALRGSQALPGSQRRGLRELTAASTAPESGVGRRWAIVGLLAAALLINSVDRGTVPTAAHLIQDDLGFSPEQLGLLMSAFFWCYAPLQPVVGWLADRFGARRVLGAGLAFWACTTMLVGLVY